jgi:hypothetical protein
MHVTKAREACYVWLVGLHVFCPVQHRFFQNQQLVCTGAIEFKAGLQ